MGPIFQSNELNWVFFTDDFNTCLTSWGLTTDCRTIYWNQKHLNTIRSLQIETGDRIESFCVLNQHIIITRFSETLVERIVQIQDLYNINPLIFHLLKDVCEKLQDDTIDIINFNYLIANKVEHVLNIQPDEVEKFELWLKERNKIWKFFIEFEEIWRKKTPDFSQKITKTIINHRTPLLRHSKIISITTPNQSGVAEINTPLIVALPPKTYEKMYVLFDIYDPSLSEKILNLFSEIHPYYVNDYLAMVKEMEAKWE